MCSLSSSVPSCNSTSLPCKLSKFIYQSYSCSVLLNFAIYSSTSSVSAGLRWTMGSCGCPVLWAHLGHQSTEAAENSGKQQLPDSISQYSLSGALLTQWDHFILFILRTYANICVDAKICFIFKKIILFLVSFFLFALFYENYFQWVFPLTLSHPFYLFEYTESKYKG